VSGEKRRVFKIISIAFGLGIGLVLGEIVLRFTLPKRMFYRIDISGTHGNYKLSDDPKLIYVPVPDTGDFNSYGHRGPAYSFEKSGKKRIIAMGDSVVAGLDIDVDQRFTDVLDKKLGGPYEVINLGVCGYSLLQEFEYFKLLGEKFSPDYVLWFITFNDMRLHSGEIANFNEKLKKTPTGSFYQAYYRTRIGLERFLLSFHTYKLLKYVFSAGSLKVFSNFEERISLDEADRVLKQLKIMSGERNFRFVFIFLPVLTDEYAAEINALKNLLRENNVPVLNFEDAFTTGGDSKSAEAYFLPKDACHFSVEGHRAFADILYRNRAQWGL
jgi:lysophospholipase L1-like esterase